MNVNTIKPSTNRERTLKSPLVGEEAEGGGGSERAPVFPATKRAHHIKQLLRAQRSALLVASQRLRRPFFFFFSFFTRCDLRLGRIFHCTHCTRAEGGRGDFTGRTVLGEGRMRVKFDAETEKVVTALQCTV